MRSHKELQERLKQYPRSEHLYYGDLGYIAWQYGTGQNVELLFIETREPGNGGVLLSSMVRVMLANQKVPYHSVYAFCLASNERARRFYRAIGFTEVDLKRSIYRDDGTVLFWITWKDLVRVFE